MTLPPFSLMDSIGRWVAVAFAAYVTYYCVTGTPEQMRRAVKSIYYIICLAEAIWLQHVQ